LHVGRRLPADGPQHSCKVGCLVNMCKGDELDGYLAAQSSSGSREVERIIYIGDGENDFCPLLRMREGDLALVRKGFTLEERIREEGGLKCEVKYWTQAWEIDE
jgi:pyridoxal phosphate phosphatase PHOSPHO2